MTKSLAIPVKDSISPLETSGDYWLPDKRHGSIAVRVGTARDFIARGRPLAAAIPDRRQTELER